MNQDKTASPASIQWHLSGIDYPVKKHELLRHARSQRAPEDVLSVLSRLPERTYGSAADVSRGIGKAE